MSMKVTETENRFGYCDFEFVCDLEFGIWNFHLKGSAHFSSVATVSSVSVLRNAISA